MSPLQATFIHSHALLCGLGILGMSRWVGALQATFIHIRALTLWVGNTRNEQLGGSLAGRAYKHRDAYRHLCVTLDNFLIRLAWVYVRPFVKRRGSMLGPLLNGVGLCRALC
jgi:hypothetical protein